MTTQTLRNAFALGVLLSIAGCPGTSTRLPPDRDKDGIADARDACPGVPGVVDEDPKKNGCPKDADSDGIADAQDACPDVPGVMDADLQKNGCPSDVDANIWTEPDTNAWANLDPLPNGVHKRNVDVLPTKVTSLFQFIDKDAPIVVNVPRVDKVITAVDLETREAITKQLLDTIGKELPFDAAVNKNLLESYNGAVVFTDPGISGGGEQFPTNPACVAIKFPDFRAVDLALSSKGVERTGALFIVKTDKAKEPLRGVWLADSGVLLGCMTRAALSRSLAVANGKLPSFSSSPRFVADRANDVFISVDMHSLLGDAVEPDSALFASMTTPDQSLGLDLRLNLYGPSYPPVGSFIAPASPTLIGKMPQGTIGAMGFSLKRAAGKVLRSVFTLLDKATNGNRVQEAKEAIAKLGVNFADIDAALGDDLAVGVYRNPKQKIDFAKGAGFADTAILVAFTRKDHDTHKKLWSTLTALAKKKPTEFSVRANVIETIENSKDPKKAFARIDSDNGAIVIGVGDKATVKEALAKFGSSTATIGWTTAFTKAREKVKPSVHAIGFLDGATLSSLVGSKGGKPTTSTADGLAFFSMMFGSTNRGLELTLTGGGAMDLLGIGATLAISGVNASVAEARTSEAPTNLRFIASYAKNAYEREIATGKGARRKFCKSSLPVPATIPKGTTYKPKTGQGGDWTSGDDDTGWKCLGFSTNDEIRYQYEYRQGGNYKGPARGAPNPGKNGFEVSAEGDLDGDGKTSLFTLRGRIVGAQIVLDDEVFSSDPTE